MKELAAGVCAREQGVRQHRGPIGGDGQRRGVRGARGGGRGGNDGVDVAAIAAWLAVVVFGSEVTERLRDCHRDDVC